MRILFITQLFDPENSIKGLEFAKRLCALGHNVEVVTTFPSYPEGKIYAGYRQRLRQVDVHEDITVVRLPTFINHGTSAAKRMISYMSFGFAVLLDLLLHRKRFDVIYAYYPPVVAGLVAMLIGIFRRVPFVYDVQDLWPEVLVATGSIKPRGAIFLWVDRLCGLLYRRASRIVVLSDGYKRVLIEKHVSPSKIARIYNWCDENRLCINITRNPVELDVKYFNILYAGNFGAAQSLEYVIEAANEVRNIGNDFVRFVFLGTGVAEDALKSRVSELNLDNVQFLPRVLPDRVSDYFLAADVLLVHLADDPVFAITIPQKTQAYLMAGRPILLAVRGEAADILRDAGAGLVVEPCQPDQLAQAAIALSMMPREELDMMANRAANFYQEKMCMDNGVRAIDTLLKSVVSN